MAFIMASRLHQHGISGLDVPAEYVVPIVLEQECDVQPESRGRRRNRDARLIQHRSFHPRLRDLHPGLNGLVTVRPRVDDFSTTRPFQPDRASNKR